MTSAQLLHIRISHVCWWLEPAADLVIALRAWRLLSDSCAIRLLMILLARDLCLDEDEPAIGERRHG